MTVVYTSQQVYTTNTLTTSRPVTVTSTGFSSNSKYLPKQSLQPERHEIDLFIAPAATTTVSSASVAGAAIPTAMGKYALGGVAAVALGFAAAL